MNPERGEWRDMGMDLTKLLRELGAELEHAPPPALARQRDRLRRAIAVAR
ncbi:hypothetical protein J4573_32475 [Actinomadura barringtoniae]|uniref:Uncharacterized protein n=1 Tax=Actinomadura barringtoniae TaxID=1427535 RepID=A0A939PFD9_9ACTN|nr:hypothetical protein [Actinomadura barringtoniae]MBO2451842.1 hypothetical protein [Actinomadura barringtoniae]